MADPRVGRASHGSLSPRLGRRDPRLRANAAGAVSDNDLDQKTVARDGQGRQRVSALDNLPPLAATASLSEVIAQLNTMRRLIRGQA